MATNKKHNKYNKYKSAAKFMYKSLKKGAAVFK